MLKSTELLKIMSKEDRKEKQMKRLIMSLVTMATGLVLLLIAHSRALDSNYKYFTISGFVLCLFGSYWFYVLVSRYEKYGRF